MAACEYGGYGSFDIGLDSGLEHDSQPVDNGYESGGVCSYDGGDGPGFEDGGALLP